MTLQATVKWGHGNGAVVDSADAFTELLTRLEAEAYGHPMMINITTSDKRSLVLGLGRNKSVLSLVGPEGSLPYFASIGDEATGDDIWFDYHGHPTDFKSRNAVPISSARVAAAQFLSGAELPDAVLWEEI